MRCHYCEEKIDDDELCGQSYGLWFCTAECATEWLERLFYSGPEGNRTLLIGVTGRRPHQMPTDPTVLVTED